VKLRLIYGLLLVATLLVTTGILATDPLYTSLLHLSLSYAAVDQEALLASDSERLKYGTIGGMVSVLDDYSTWHDRRTDTLVRREARGHYGGFGIEIVRFADTTMVWRVFPQTPAEEAGLQLGDRLLGADTIGLVGVRLDSVHTLLLTLPLEEVPLHIYRPGDRSTQTLHCRRADIDVGTVTVWGQTDDVAYLAVGGFNQRTSGALERALDTLTQNGVGKFIIDLRGNPGGLLYAAVECASIFMPREGAVVSVSARPREEIRRERGPYPTEPVVFLVDEHSASGSELLAGCLQDWDRAILVGAPTFGKGFVQNLFPLHDRSSLRLTVGRYRTPSGRTFYRPDTTRTTDTTRYTSLVHGRTIVGGGQIFPDVESPGPDCPGYLGRMLTGQGPFDFAAMLLARPTLPRLDARLAQRYWQEQQERYSPVITERLAEIAPAKWPEFPAWRRVLAEAEKRENDFDQIASSDCFLYVLARHLARAGRPVPLLEDPLLSADPALSEALTILRTPGRYEAIITGRNTTPAPADPAT
jgi:carboxyl-terminal processing protease